VRRKKKNIVLENVLVEDYAAEGKSIARVDGKVIFIERVVPGDIVDVKLFKSKRDWAEGFAHFLKKEQNLFASILVFAVAANGKCCLMKNSFFTNDNRLRIISGELVRSTCPLYRPCLVQKKINGIEINLSIRLAQRDLSPLPFIPPKREICIRIKPR
jgi:predicted RNA-binding protein with TRAM domain